MGIFAGREVKKDRFRAGMKERCLLQKVGPTLSRALKGGQVKRPPPGHGLGMARVLKGQEQDARPSQAMFNTLISKALCYTKLT